MLFSCTDEIKKFIYGGAKNWGVLRTINRLSSIRFILQFLLYPFLRLVRNLSVFFDLVLKYRRYNWTKEIFLTTQLRCRPQESNTRCSNCYNSNTTIAAKNKGVRQAVNTGEMERSWYSTVAVIHNPLFHIVWL